MSNVYRHGKCRYCERYSRACGRPHSVDTMADWARTWDGHPLTVSASDLGTGATVLVLVDTRRKVITGPAAHPYDAGAEWVRVHDVAVADRDAGMAYVMTPYGAWPTSAAARVFSSTTKRPS